MVRGIERTVIFRDDTDRADFVTRLAALVEAGALTVYAWALLPNHAHLLVRTGSRPRPRSMRSLLTGYAGAFNRRHRRAGHLLQNRYKSIVVEAEPYLLELVRYLHLNPLRAQVVPDLRALARYPLPPREDHPRNHVLRRRFPGKTGLPGGHPACFPRPRHPRVSRKGTAGSRPASLCISGSYRAR